MAQKATEAPVTVALFSLNDFHGGFVKDEAKGIPGAANVMATIDSLKSVYPYHLTVSAGDNFGGSYFYKATNGALMPRFFGDLGITLSVMGNHEFDDGVERLAKKWNDSPYRPQGWDITYICSNIRDSQGNIPAYMQPFQRQTITLSPTKRLSVAFVGLLASSTPSQVSKSRIKGLSFDGNYTGVLDSLKRTAGYEQVASADLRLLLMHVGTKMVGGAPAWDDLDSLNLSTINDPSYHAFLTGHSHKPVVGVINDRRYPVVQGKWHGEYISVMKFQIDTVSMRVLGIEPEIVYVNGTIPLGDKQLALEKEIQKLLVETKTKGGAPIGEQLTIARKTLIHDRDDKYHQTEVGTLVCESFDVAARKTGRFRPQDMIFGSSHFGSVRSGFTKGAVRVLDVGESLPFANNIRVFKLTGAQVKRLLNVGFHNVKYGTIQTSRLSFRFDKQKNIKKIYYTSPWGKRTRVKDDCEIYVAVDEFQANGGDGYSPELFPKSQEVKDLTLPATTDAFINYLRTLPQI